MTHLLRQALAALEQPAPSIPDSVPPEPRDRRPLQRRLKAERTIVTDTRCVYTLEEGRTMLEQTAATHLASGKASALILAMPPGTGKTYRAVKTAEWCAAQGMRVLVLGPRREFFADVIRFADRPEWWYDWLPRQEGDEAAGQLSTCLYTKELTTWLNKGYGAMDFCSNSRICGWPYITEGQNQVANGIPLIDVRGGCRYHAQKKVRHPIIFGRHQHLTMGHPLMKEFDVIIGDELPLDAFLHHWTISQKHIAPSGMDVTDPFTEIVHTLATLADDGVEVSGPHLLTLLGGATHVQAACADWQIRIDEQFINPTLKSAGAVENVPYFHLLSLGKLLYRESLAAQQQQEYPHRIALANKKLHLLLRRTINEQALNKPMLWLDATANEHLYGAMFDPVSVEVVSPHIKLTGAVHQVWNRSNNKRSFVTTEGGLSIDSKDKRPKLEQVLLQVKQIVARGNYQRPVVMTYQDLVPWFTEEGYEAAHFYAARGTNRYEACDAVIVIGTPQPSLLEIEKAARMLFFNRMEPFNPDWSERDVPYTGQPYSYPVSGFWHDPDLNAMLWQQREAELIQAAHRVRPLWRDADVWLLTNIPLDGVPPDELLTINDLFDAPGNVDPYQWPAIAALVDEFYEAGLCFTAADIVERLGIPERTARRYWEYIRDIQPERWEVIEALRPKSDKKKSGRPSKTLRPITV